MAAGTGASDTSQRIDGSESNPSEHTESISPLSHSRALEYHLHNMAQYRYSPLADSHVRILRLNRGKGNHPLRCTIEHISITSQQYFSAISYVWGTPAKSREPEKRHWMLVGDRHYIPLTKSLDRVLRNLREMGERDIGDLVFWADQISINQQNLEERGKQVEMMGKIFQKASQVITYTGAEAPTDLEGLELARKFQHLWRQIKDSHMEHDIASALSFMKNLLPDHSSESWRSMASIFYREWSTRLWMIQETTVNPNTLLVFGQHVIKWNLPSTAVLLASFETFPARLKYVLLEKTVGQSLDWPQSQSTTQLLILRAWFAEHQRNSQPLFALLETSRYFSCSDPRDKIYGVLGLASDNAVLQICPDYTKSPREVLTDTARRIIQSNRVLDLLNHVEYPKAIDVPSWVPDWDHPRSRYLLDYRSFDNCASGDTKAIVVLENDGSTLLLSGKIIDTVTCYGGDLRLNASLFAHQPEIIYDEYPRMVKMFRRVSRGLGFEFHETDSPIELLETLSRTIIADRRINDDALSIPDGISRVPSVLLQKFLSFCESLCTSKNSEPAPLIQNPCDDVAYHEAIRFMEYLCISEGRSLCATSHKRLGLVPKSSKEGDSIAILMGGKTPYILRSNGDSFSLIGEAYIDGMMQGECFRDDDFMDTLQTIRLQ
jgi:hypothetical protein